MAWSQPAPPALLAAIAGWAAATAALLLDRRRDRHRDVSAAPVHGRLTVAGYSLCIVALGWAGAAHRLDAARRTAPTSVLPAPSGDIELVGLIAEFPRVEPAARRDRVYMRVAVKADRMRMVGDPEWQAVDAIVTASWFAPGWARLPAYGERWQFAGGIKAYPEWRTPARQPAATRYYLHAERDNSERLAPAARYGLVGQVAASRRAFAACLEHGIADFPETTGLLQALLLGYRDRLPRAIKDTFVATGTVHIFAVSGLHVGIVAFFFVFALQAAKVPRPRWALFLAPLLILYTMLTGAKASAIRACVMAIVYFSAPLFQRRANALSSLALAAVIILAWNPLQLFDIGFQFSFAVVLGLITLCPVIDRPLRRWLQPDPLASPIPLDQRAEGRWKPAARKVGYYLCGLWSVTAVSWLIATPLTAYFFERVSIIGLVANLVVAPMAFLIVLTGCLSMILGSCFLFAADIFNHANLVLVHFLLAFVDLLAKTPGGYFEVPKPPHWFMGLWYGAIVVWVVRSRRRAGIAELHSA